MYKAHPYFPLNKFGQKNAHYTRQNTVPTLNDAFCYCFVFGTILDGSWNFEWPVITTWTSASLTGSFEKWDVIYIEWNVQILKCHWISFDKCVHWCNLYPLLRSRIFDFCKYCSSFGSKLYIFFLDLMFVHMQHYRLVICLLPWSHYKIYLIK